MLLARIAPARILSDDDKHSGAGVKPEDCRFVLVHADSRGRAFLAAAWNLGYAVLNLGEVSPGWGEPCDGCPCNFGYTAPLAENVPCVA